MLFKKSYAQKKNILYFVSIPPHCRYVHDAHNRYDNIRPDPDVLCGYGSSNDGGAAVQSGVDCFYTPFLCQKMQALKSIKRPADNGGESEKRH